MTLGSRLAAFVVISALAMLVTDTPAQTCRTCPPPPGATYRYPQTYYYVAPPPVRPLVYHAPPVAVVPVAIAAAPTPPVPPVTASPQSPPGVVATLDPYGFIAWLNGVRAARGLAVVAYDPGLAASCHANNAHQHGRGLGHHSRRGRRSNVGQGSMGSVCSAWLASPPHAAALLDPSVSRVGIASDGAYWTYEGD